MIETPFSVCKKSQSVLNSFQELLPNNCISGKEMLPRTRPVVIFPDQNTTTKLASFCYGSRIRQQGDGLIDHI